MNANDIFISYSTKNTDIAKTIRDLFQSHGITCWMAPESIPAGSQLYKGDSLWYPIFEVGCVNIIKSIFGICMG